MKKLESFDEYNNLLKEVKSVCKRPFSNIYYMSSAIKKYINLGRLYFEKTERGVLFFLDEESYYRVCLFVNEKEKFEICPKDKKILVKNIYKSGEKEEKLLLIEQRLRELEFQKEGTSICIQGESSKILHQCEQMGQYIEMLLEKRGYRCVVADSTMFGDIEAIIVESGVIKDYQLNYRTEEEKKELESGSYLCIVDEKGKICAVSVCVLEDGVAKGVAISVKEEYKMQGLAPMLTYHRFKWMCENKIELTQAWILINNEPSLKYHQSLGYEFLDKYADEWILETNDKCM